MGRLEILLGTGNMEKVNRMRGVIEGFGGRVVVLDDLETVPEIEEKGASFEENAKLKAVAFSQVYEGYVIATDGGVAIPKLEGWNGLFSHRFAGEEASDRERIEALLTMMEGLEGEDRRVFFTESLAIAKDGEVLACWTKESERGYIAKTWDPKKQRDGFWLPSIWINGRTGKVLVDMSEEDRRQGVSSWDWLGERVDEFFRELV